MSIILLESRGIKQLKEGDYIFTPSISNVNEQLEVSFVFYQFVRWTEIKEFPSNIPDAEQQYHAFVNFIGEIDYKAAFNKQTLDELIKSFNDKLEDDKKTGQKTVQQKYMSLLYGYFTDPFDALSEFQNKIIEISNCINEATAYAEQLIKV